MLTQGGRTSTQVKTSRTFLRDATAVSPLALALFGSGSLAVVHEGGYILLDGWLRFRAPAQVHIPCSPPFACHDGLLNLLAGHTSAQVSVETALKAAPHLRRLRCW